MHQYGKAKACQDQLTVGGGVGKCHPARPPFLGTNHGHDHLRNGDDKGKNQGEVCEFY